MLNCVEIESVLWVGRIRSGPPCSDKPLPMHVWNDQPAQKPVCIRVAWPGYVTRTTRVCYAHFLQSALPPRWQTVFPGSTHVLMFGVIADTTTTVGKHNLVLCFALTPFWVPRGCYAKSIPDCGTLTETDTCIVCELNWTQHVTCCIFACDVLINW